MVLRCITCGVENPATNFYCGQCGAKLHRTAAETPERNADPRGGETTVEERAKEEAERKRRTEIAHWKEIELESRGIFMPWNLKAPGSDPARDAANDRTLVGPAPEPLASQPLVRENVIAGGERVETQNTVATSIPVARGLSNAPVAQPDVAQPKNRKRAARSHPRRNLALATLATVAILAAFQWRFVRNYVVPYVQHNLQQARRHDVPAVALPALPAGNTSAAPMKEPSAFASLTDGRSGADIAPPHGGNAPAPGAAEMYQAAHATDARLRVAWLWKAMRAGSPQAPIELAKLYEEGEGVTQSCDQARILLKAAAAKGNAQAKFGLQQLQLSGGCAAQ